jgi:ABC-2 type transport system permease protein
VRLSLGKWWVIARREWQVAFQTPLAYVLLGLWMLIGGYMYVGLLMFSGTTDLGQLVQNLTVVVLFVAPFLTMRLLAEERRTGSEELVLTAPISATQWVLGKYAGAVLVWTVFVAVSFLFPLVTSRLGVLDWGVTAVSWGGLWLFGDATLAIGLFASSLTDNQLVAAMVSFVITLLFYISNWLQTSGPLSGLMEYINLPDQLTGFSVGTVAVSHLVFFLSLIAGFLFLSVRSVDLRRWT